MPWSLEGTSMMKATACHSFKTIWLNLARPSCFMTSTSFTTTCCISGGGPAGMMAGLLLARAGIDVMVLEKHADFFRDFRGDTIHPSTFQLMHELDMLDDFLNVPHQEIQTLGARFNGRFLQLADFSHLGVAKPALGLMPQWDFLNFLKDRAKAYPHFHLLMQTKAVDLLKQDERIVGVKAQTPDGLVAIHAKLVIGADGRHSDVREKAGLQIISTGVPIDVLWFRLSKKATDPSQSLGNFYYGKMMVLLDRAEYWQCAYVIDKGDFENIKQKGLPVFRHELAEVVPFLHDRMNELQDWEQVKLLSVAIDRLEKWYTPGLLCIGDAAHAMSPIGGVGINLALQDAVAAANILYQSLRENKNIDSAILQHVQKRRELPTKFTQRLQVTIQKGIISRRLQAGKQNKPPLVMRLLNRWPLLRRLPARLIGIGFRPEHIRTPGPKN